MNTTRRTLIKTMVCSIMLYGANSWNMLMANKIKIEKYCWSSMLKKDKG